MNKQYMVTATFTKENMKVPAEYMLGLLTPFYCGGNLEEAISIYEQLVNFDKELIVAKVEYSNLQGEKFVKNWTKVKSLDVAKLKKFKIVE